MVYLFDHQKLAVDQLKTGSILCGGVGSGKSLTAIMYFYTKECEGKVNDINGFLPMKKSKDLYIITTAAKRDTLDWERECANFMISTDKKSSVNNIKLVVNSWNNIKKYENIKNAFFIFDEQRVIGSGAWVKSFLIIVKHNNWILLSATPGDTWLDYIPVFIANGFYKNRTEFIRRHVVFKSYIKFPKIDHYVEEMRLNKLKKMITVNMTYHKPTKIISNIITVPYDKEKLKIVLNRWNPYNNSPIREISSYCYLLRKVVNSDPSRLEEIRKLAIKHRRIVVFYNFNYELEILRELKNDKEIGFAEYNGHKHEPVPKTESWIYIVQYISGAEGWNCIESNTIVFYSLNYSFRMMTQAAGRIDRLNTPFANLYYYYIKSVSIIDVAISKALEYKQNFNESDFLKGD